MKKLRSLLLCAAGVAALTVALHASGAEIMLGAGDIAPHVCGVNSDGQHWKLYDHLARRVVFLYFYPKDGAAPCAAEACLLRDNMPEFKQMGVQVVGVSFDDINRHKDFIFKYNIPFPLLADTAGILSDTFGVRDGALNMDRRVSFLIGPDGRIIRVTDSPDPAEHLAQLQAALAKLAPALFP